MSKKKDPFLNQDIVDKKEKLVELLKKKSKVYDKVKDIYHFYNIPDDWVSRLPAESFKDLSYSLEDSSVNFLKLRSKLREEHDEGTSELSKIESEISIGQIELLLAKINSIDKYISDGYNEI